MKRQVTRWALTLIAALTVFAVSGCDMGVPQEGNFNDVATLAETGFGNSLFESANDKCQHCHYDLHETWSNSMHAQSWVDPIFQTKYRDFFAHLLTNKLNVTNANGTITATTVEKLGAVCLNCHAPMAMKSSDYSITVAAAQAGDVTTNNPTDADFDPTQAFTLVATNALDSQSYKVTMDIGNPTNEEGIACALCHSMEHIPMTKAGDIYTLAADIKTSPIGSVVYAAGTDLIYSASSQDPMMNAFFKLVGPEKYSDPGLRVSKTKDGRFMLKKIPVGEYAGGPYFGPYGNTGTGAVHDNDNLDRQALLQEAIDAGHWSQTDNFFEQKSKALCLSCHQRSAGAIDPVSGQFMELCTTWTVTDDNAYPTASSPKCTKCHMEKRNGIVVNAPRQPGVPSRKELNLDLTTNIELGMFHSHQFEGASVSAKVKAGMAATLSASKNADNSLAVTTSLLNETAHMFPGAHPMRRMVTLVQAEDAAGNLLSFSSGTIATSYNNNVTYEYDNAEANLYAPVSVAVTARTTTPDAGNPPITFSGQVITANGAVTSQWFDDNQNDVGADSIFTKRISTDLTATRFARVYGRETMDDATGGTPGAVDAGDVVKSGFASNTAIDNRLLPNQKETYSLTFAAGAASYPVTVTYKVYYLKKGAKMGATGGNMPIGADGWYDEATAAADKTKPIYEIYTKTVTVN